MSAIGDTGRCRAARVGLSLLALWACPARPADLVASAEFQYQRSFPGVGSPFDAFWERYIASYGQSPSDLLSYRLGLYYNEARTPLFSSGPTSIGRQLSPNALISYNNQGLTLGASYTFNWGNSDGLIYSNQYTHQLTLNGNLQLSPAFALSAFAQRVMTSGTTVPSSAADMLGLWANYTKQLSATAGVMFDHYVEEGDRFNRVRVSPTVSVAYGDGLFDGKLVYSLSGSGTYNWMKEVNQSSNSVTIAPREIIPAQGLFVRAELPADTSTTPMASIPALIDRVYDVSTGIDLGPTGLSYANIAVAFNQPTKMDMFYLYVRDQLGRYVPYGGNVTWSAWSSYDGKIWTQIQSSAFFDAALSRYVVGFAPSEGRYFKIVNFGVNDIPTFVTEIVAIIHAAFVPGQTLISTGFGSQAAATLGGTPVEGVNLNYGVNVNQAASAGFGSSVGSWNWGQNASANFGPFVGLRPMVYAAQAQSLVQDQPTLNTLSGGAQISYGVQPYFTVSGSGDFAYQTYGETWVRSMSGTLNGSLRPLEVLTFSASGALARAILNNGTNTYVTVSTTLTAALRSDLFLGVTGAAQRSIAGGANVQPGIPINQIQEMKSATAGLNYRPSNQLQLNGRIGFFNYMGISALTWGFMVGWTPLPDGAVSLRASYAHDVDSTNGRVSRRLRLDATWAMSRHVSWSAAYNDESSSLGPPFRSFWLSLLLNL